MLSKWAANLACLLLFNLAPAALFAEQCLDPSPTRLNGKNIFDAVVPRDLTPSEFTYVQRMLQSLHGDWTGEGVETRCRGLNDPTDKDVVFYILEGDVETDSSGNLVLELDLDDTNNNTSHSQVFRLYLKEQRLRYESDDGAGEVELLALGPSQIKFVFRVFVIKGSRKGSPKRIEFFIELISERDAFSIHRDVYTKGKLTSQWHWRFKR